MYLNAPCNDTPMFYTLMPMKKSEVPAAKIYCLGGTDCSQQLPLGFKQEGNFSAWFSFISRTECCWTLRNAILYTIVSQTQEALLGTCFKLSSTTQSLPTSISWMTGKLGAGIGAGIGIGCVSYRPCCIAG